MTSVIGPPEHTYSKRLSRCLNQEQFFTSLSFLLVSSLSPQSTAVSPRRLAPPVPQQREHHPPGDPTQRSCCTQDPWGHWVHAPRQDYPVLRLPAGLHPLLCWWPGCSLPFLVFPVQIVLWLHVVSRKRISECHIWVLISGLGCRKQLMC